MGDRSPDSPPPPENYKNIGFLSNTCPDPLKKQKTIKPAFNFSPYSALQRRFAGGPTKPAFSGILIISLHKRKTKQNNRCQSWTPTYKIFLIRACLRICECACSSEDSLQDTMICTKPHMLAHMLSFCIKRRHQQVIVPHIEV